jgi:hypothetical protein
MTVPTPSPDPANRLPRSPWQRRQNCRYGNWLKWLKKNVKFSDQRASEYMRIAKLPVTGNLADDMRHIWGNAPAASAEKASEEN